MRGSKVPHEEVFMPLEEAMSPRTGFVMTDRYWVYKDGKGILFIKMGGSPHLIPQCNSNAAIAESIQADLYPNYEVMFLETAFVGYVTGRG